MEGNTYTLRWDSYKSNLSKGFSKLQQMQEFVDVTIAAGGHLIGAHQNILALASPYFKEMLKSAPCRHPVIFLGHINPTVLAFILEYVYTGEVQVPSSVLPSFVKASKMLYISGIKDIEIPEKHTHFDVTLRSGSETQHAYTNSPVNIPEPNIIAENEANIELSANLNTDVPSESHNQHSINSGPLNTLAHVTIGEGNQVTVHPLAVEEIAPLYTTDDQPVPMPSDIQYQASNVESHDYGSREDDRSNDNQDYFLGDENMTIHNEDCRMEADFVNESEVTPENPTESPSSKQDSQEANQTDYLDKNNPSPDKAPYTQNIPFTLDVATESGLITLKQMPGANKTNEHDQSKKLNAILGNISHNVLYAKSIRGSLMMLLNRYIYNLHFTSYRGHKRRWRCIEYRRCRCRAYVDTFDEGIKARKNTHVHGFHDAKIIKLGRSKQFYTSLSQAVNLEPGLKNKIDKTGNYTGESNIDEESE